jgi:hypothetical protein
MSEDRLQNMVLEFQEINNLESLHKNGGNYQKLKTIRHKKDDLFQNIEREYKLQQRIKTWADSYLQFFDSYDDFYVMCRTVFYKAICNWKPVEKRLEEKKKKYKNGKIKKEEVKIYGNGEVNTYFAYCLGNRLINHYKKTLAQSRNPNTCCPICGEEVSPLKQHLKEEHEEFFQKMWKKYKNMDFDKFDKCPICGYNADNLFKHMGNRHPEVLYELFHFEYPNYFISERAQSLDYQYYSNDESDNGIVLSDMISINSGDDIIEDIQFKIYIKELNNKLSLEEKKLLNELLIGSKRKNICEFLNWDFNEYNKIRKSLKNKIEKLLS